MATVERSRFGLNELLGRVCLLLRVARVLRWVGGRLWLKTGFTLDGIDLLLKPLLSIVFQLGNITLDILTAEICVGSRLLRACTARTYQKRNDCDGGLNFHTRSP